MKSLLPRILPVVLMVSMIVISCSVPNMTPMPTSTSNLTPVASTASPTSVGPQSDDVWNRIVANNKIVVGTSWDYPPFASIDSGLHPVGFDIALIKEIGRRLNIPVEIQDFTLCKIRHSSN